MEEGDEVAKQIPYVFDEIVDAKHLKYMSIYKASPMRPCQPQQVAQQPVAQQPVAQQPVAQQPVAHEFWGIGIENESYLEWSVRRDRADFCLLQPKRERYSVDYYTSFAPEPLEAVMGALRELPNITFPVWLNAHTLQKTDTRLRHRTLYDVAGTPNPEFTESLHDVLMREVPVYREMYDQSVVFDGDTIEFITQDFYRATVKGAVEELVGLKERWIGAVAGPLAKWTRGVLPSSSGSDAPSGHWRFPERNEGLVTFMTTHQKNLSLCNTQTLHLNLTLPSLLTAEGTLADKVGFMKEHLDWVSWIQVLEPLFVAVYGTPDVFSLVDMEHKGEAMGYSRGSLRASRSRYISLQTYDVNYPMNGKLLLRPRPEDPLHWYNRLMTSGPYIGYAEIGYDINVNKFKNHGIEVRFLDGIPEVYLPSIMNVMVLLGAHTRRMGCGSSYQKDAYHSIILKCLRQGSDASLSKGEQEKIWRDMGFQEGGQGERGQDEIRVTPHEMLCRVVGELYRRYKDSDVVQKMSPDMPLPLIVCYNAQVASEMREGLYGKPVLIVRAEASIFEQRVALIPTDIAILQEMYRVVVESSPTRCFSDEAYRLQGAEIIPAGSWVDYPHAWVVGLKGLPSLEKGLPSLPTQTLLHFAHCFKQQEGWRDTLENLGASRFLDYEFMLDDTGKRTLSFCRQAGHVGALLGLFAYYKGEERGVGGEFSEEEILAVVEQAMPHRVSPRILLAGYGTVGRAVKAVLDQVGLACDIRRSNGGYAPLTAEEILSYDIYFHAIRLHPTEPVAPFLTEADVDGVIGQQRRLTLVVDLSCDLGHPWNPLPIYQQYGTREEPLQRIRDASFYVPATGVPPLDVLAVPYLPSFDSVRSSTEFSGELVWYLSEGKWLDVDPGRNRMTRAMARAWEVTKEARKHE